MIQSTLRSVALRSNIKSIGGQRRTYVIAAANNHIGTSPIAWNRCYHFIKHPTTGTRQRCAFITFRSERTLFLATALNDSCDGNTGRGTQQCNDVVDKIASKENREEQQKSCDAHAPFKAASTGLKSGAAHGRQNRTCKHHHPPHDYTCSDAIRDDKRASSAKDLPNATRYSSPFTSVRKSNSNNDDGMSWSQSSSFTSSTGGNGNGSSNSGGKGSGGSGDSLKCPKCDTKCSPAGNSTY